MSRKSIPTKVVKQLYAESMGACMNPNCNLTIDSLERAHIIPYHETKDNSLENLILLCPNCHTSYDIDNKYTIEELIGWKKTRKQQQNQILATKFGTFEELETIIQPLLQENQTIYQSYYEKQNKSLWDKFQPKILQNNEKLKNLLEANKGFIE